MSHSEAVMLHVAHGEKMSSKPELQHLVDCKVLTSTALRKRYRAEANSHRNMRHRQKTQGRKIHPEFEVFRDFLAHVGPCPVRGATLDRINNNDPEYAPGKVRWADKRTQNSNKGDTLLFHYSRPGDTYTVSRLAKLQKISRSAIRKRKERGWTDDQIIEGICFDAMVDTGSSSGVSNPITNRARAAPKNPLEMRHGRDLMYKRNAAYYRETEGEEYCLCDHGTLADTAAEFGLVVGRDSYERKFARWWTEWRPHLKRKDLPEWAQELIAKIEGSTLDEIRRLQEETRNAL